MASARSDPEAFRVEPMQPDHFAEVLVIDGASFRGNRASEASLHEELARPWSNAWVARTPEGSIAAFLVSWHVVDEVHVLNVATDPAVRRQGYARALMHQVIAFAQARNVRMMMLEVRRSNGPAIELYRSLGFFAMGWRRGYYSDGEDAIEMMALFDPNTKKIVPHADDVRM